MIIIENVSFRYPTRKDFALQGINLRVNEGEFVLLAGPTGCGKTTLLKCLNGIIPHESAGEFHGQVWIDGLNTREYPVRVLAQKVGLVFQNPDEQIFSTRVVDEVAFGLENLCCRRDEMLARIEWALEKVGMAGHINSSTNSLSGGQKQRVAVASMLALKPGVLVLDEPISQLDPQGAQEVLEVVKKLSDEGITIILVEHRLHEVASWADRVIVMNDGMIELDTSARKVHEHLDCFEKLGLRNPIVKKGLRPVMQAMIFPGAVKGEHKVEAIENEVIENEGADSAKRQRKLIEVRDLWFAYNSRKARNKENWVLKGIDLDIYAGEVVAVLGNNGSGKTTLLHHLAGLHKPQKGRVTVAGKDTIKNNAYRLAGTAGILFQNPSLMLTCDTVYDEVAFGPRNLRLRKEDISNRVAECLVLMELEDLAPYHPQSLSGGQRLRCAAAAILSMSPAVILLDEPTSGQDILHIRKLMGLCRELAKQGKAVVFITHDFEVAAEYSDRIVVMRDGKISLECSAEDILPAEGCAGTGNKPEWNQC
ncbi:MAG: energy-coupling factor transporter ATPase [Peptococcaceae bacterium]|nr:energy-coupling factor transporter ATPase [Peptococcaceae bacterium]MDH7524943.1 energy-coupling factor transporter ATPase [Peptococcaceae bacterium]